MIRLTASSTLYAAIYMSLYPKDLDWRRNGVKPFVFSTFSSFYFCAFPQTISSGWRKGVMSTGVDTRVMSIGGQVNYGEISSNYVNKDDHFHFFFCVRGEF
ncbi:hypothetical protein NPIL_308131 [Nephila pilipes]|uniref:Uncharacterized protein n=1 Tax=Nephila pilipes TaxID=299642 RepID=A0A8X6MZ85_NEPPI|nr:hypothetical protein NPIL_308131 [Nephila pilipes]